MFARIWISLYSCYRVGIPQIKWAVGFLAKAPNTAQFWLTSADKGIIVVLLSLFPSTVVIIGEECLQKAIRAKDVFG